MGVEKIFKIRINSSEINKDNAFEILMKSKLSILCLEDENYIIPAQAIELLNEKGVSYEFLKLNGVNYAPENTR